MKKALLGVYDTEKKARNVVEGLIVQGYQAEEIVIVALGDSLGSDYPMGTRIERIVEEEEDSVVDKILLPEEVQAPQGVGNKLLELGLSDHDAPMYATDVENGRILVLVNKRKSKEAQTVEPCVGGRDQQTMPMDALKQVD
ncbi:general stress protein [Sutcliffiella horikoshii]|uniref:general stress protein n=1 Tax=Sutcliffiella horikoshii TaxID=79883 RepID=UPI00204071E6|nr:general stress protein [Sutcliffiella horikoshii]MCM3620051.1 general stress protein [Sutcliffiella horikoshii]